jgi:hypothetical protein
MAIRNTDTEVVKLTAPVLSCSPDGHAWARCAPQVSSSA